MPHGTAAIFNTKTILPTHEEEFTRFARSEAFLKMEEYRRRLFAFEKKYDMTLEQFKKVITRGKEDFQKWDALIEWEGLDEAHRAWGKRYQSLRS